MEALDPPRSLPPTKADLLQTSGEPRCRSQSDMAWLFAVMPVGSCLVEGVGFHPSKRVGACMMNG